MGTTPRKPAVLIVDDERDEISLISSILDDSYKVDSCGSGAMAIARCLGPSPPDLVLLDVLMPNLDGYETCRRLKSNARTLGIPVLFLTARSGVVDESLGFEAGGEDYIVKPIRPEIVRARVRAHLRLKASRDEIEAENRKLETIIERRVTEIGEIEDATFMALGSLAETRDNDKKNHVARTQILAHVLSRSMASLPGNREILDDKMIHYIFKAAPLHDIGKVGIPDSILQKPGFLSADEFEIMKRHTVIGHDALEHAETQLGYQSRALSVAREIALYHHERWDGSGYPHGLAGETIPLTARIMAVTDVFDSMVSDKVYRAGTSPQDAVSAIVAESGSSFDPAVVLAFQSVSRRFVEIVRTVHDMI